MKARIIYWLFVLSSLLVVHTNGENNRAIDFSLSDIQGNPYSLSQNLGKDVILLNFWATYCIPCRAEMKDFERLYQKHKDSGFEIIAVSIDEPQTAAQIPGFISQGGYTYKILIDPEKKVYGLYNGVALPTTLIIDKQGNIVKRIQSYFKGEEVILDSIVSGLLSQSPGEAGQQDKSDSSGFLKNINISGSNYLRANSGSEGRYDENANWYEDWFDLRVGSPRLSYKMRFRSYQFLQDIEGEHKNVVRNANHRVVKQLLKFENDFSDIQAGNIYANIGRGLAFRTWEDRNARIDKDLQGAKLQIKGSPWLVPGKASLGLLGGKVFGNFTDLNLHDAIDSTRDTHVQGVYGSYSPVKNLKLGFHGMEAFPSTSGDISSANVRLAGGYTEIALNRVNLYTSYIQGEGEDEFNFPNDYTSRALYTSLSSQLGMLDMGLEYKYYFNYAFDFTDPPNLLKFHTFRLMARNLLFSNNQREEGVQAKLGYRLPGDVISSTNVSYIVSSPERSTLYYLHHVDLPFLDVNQDIEIDAGKNTKLLLDVNYNDRRIFFEGHFEDQQAYTWGSEIERILSRNYSLQFVFELQHVNLDIIDRIPPVPADTILGAVGDPLENHQYQQSAFYVTLAKLGNWSITVDYELTNFHLEDDSKSIHHSLPGVANGWVSAYLTYEGFKGHQVSLWGGQRKVRVICSGGSCREEPAFEGVELIVTSHF